MILRKTYSNKSVMLFCRWLEAFQVGTYFWIRLLAAPYFSLNKGMWIFLTREWGSDEGGSLLLNERVLCPAR